MEMWFEKYRPQSIEDYVCDDRTKSIINNTLKTQTHLLLHGSAGSGKTTLCKILTNKVGGKGDVLVINASEENNVDVVRHKIQTFIVTMGWSQEVRDGISKKIVFLDEFDYMSKESQAILRGVLEKYTSRVMFLMTCNYIDKVIEPIQSRCFTRKLMTPNIHLVKDRCIHILNSEGVSYDEKDLNLLVNVCYPDFRKTINILQNHSIDNRLEPIDTIDYECKRLTILDRLTHLLDKIEYNSNYLFKLNQKELEEFQVLMKHNQFLVERIDCLEVSNVS